MTILVQLLIGLGAMTAVMVGLWSLQLRTRNANTVDAAWSAGLGLMAIFAAVTSGGLPSRRLLLVVVAGTWAFRLAGYLLRDRVFGYGEDPRYRELRKSWGDRADWNFLVFFVLQAVLVIVLSLPFFVVAHHSASFSLFDAAGALLGLVAVAGETVADFQLNGFREDSANRGQVCSSGLWRYSRHPNYFFEWLHWWAYPLLGLGAAYGWLTLLGPAVMFLFLFKVTGIPTTEQRALQSRGEAYRRYQQTTSQFFPWFPKEG